MKRLIFTCVVFFACGSVFGNEPTPANEPTTSKPTVIVPTSGACRNGSCRLSRRSRTRIVNGSNCANGNCRRHRTSTTDGGTVIRTETVPATQPTR